MRTPPPRHALCFVAFVSFAGCGASRPAAPTVVAASTPPAGPPPATYMSLRAPATHGEPPAIAALHAARPTPTATWIDGYFDARNGAWVWVEGHWEEGHDRTWQPPAYVLSYYFPGYWRYAWSLPPMVYASAGRDREPAAPHGLPVPGVVQGTLEASDTPLADGSVADDYTLLLVAGAPLTIVVRGGPSTSTPGSNLDMYAILLHRGQEVTHDDDSAGNQNSRIVFTPPETGTYLLRITTYGAGLKTGAYTVETLAGSHPDAT